MAILHIYGAKAILLLFYDDQETEKEKWEIQMSTSKLILTHEIYQRLHLTMISILYWMVENTVVIIRIYGAKAILLLFYDDQETEKEKWEIQMSTSKLILTHEIYQRLHLTMISILYWMVENTVVIIRIYGARAIFLLFYDDQDTENE